MPEAQTTNEEIRNSPVAWFFELEDARRQSDFERAAYAQRELKRLGVEVRYRSVQSRRTNHG